MVWLTKKIYGSIWFWYAQYLIMNGLYRKIICGIIMDVSIVFETKILKRNYVYNA